MSRNSYSIWGTEGMITLHRTFSIPADLSPTATLDPQDFHEEFNLKPEDQFFSEIQHFCKNIKNKSNREMWTQDSLEHATLLEKIKQKSVS